MSIWIVIVDIIYGGAAIAFKYFPSIRDIRNRLKGREANAGSAAANMVKNICRRTDGKIIGSCPAEHVDRHPLRDTIGVLKSILFEMILDRTHWKVTLISIEGAFTQISVVQKCPVRITESQAHGGCVVCSR